MTRPEHWSTAKAWHTNAALLLLGAGLLFLSRQLIAEYSNYTIGFSGVSGWSVILYAAACVLILTQPVDRYTFPIILTVAIACRLVTLFPEPFLSSDVYRYAWDGVVQHAGINPYRYVPGDPALAFLREPNQDLFDHINRRDYAHTIYPPAAQALFYLITFINPELTFMKTAMVLFEGVTMWGLVALLGELGVRRERTLLYAWCPVGIWEIAGAGHLDSVAMAFLVLALLARYQRKDVLTGVFLALAVMTKLYPLVLFPALYRRGDWKMPAVMAAMIGFGYACYSSVGMGVFGFFGGYVKEEGMDSGSRYFLLELVQHLPGLHGMPPAAFFAFAGLVFAALIYWCWRTCSTDTSLRMTVHGQRTTTFLAPAFALGLTMNLLFSPRYPWYVAWLIPFFVLLPNLPAVTYICGLFYFCYTALAVGYGPKQFQLNEWLYGAVLTALVVMIALRSLPLNHLVFRDKVNRW